MSVRPQDHHARFCGHALLVGGGMGACGIGGDDCGGLAVPGHIVFDEALLICALFAAAPRPILHAYCVFTTACLLRFLACRAPRGLAVTSAVRALQIHIRASSCTRNLDGSHEARKANEDSHNLTHASLPICVRHRPSARSLAKWYPHSYERLLTANAALCS